MPSDLYLIVFRVDDGPVQAIFESEASARDRYERMRQSWSEVFLCRVEDGPRDVLDEQRRVLAMAPKSTVATKPITLDEFRAAVDAASPVDKPTPPPEARPLTHEQEALDPREERHFGSLVCRLCNELTDFGISTTSNPIHRGVAMHGGRWLYPVCESDHGDPTTAILALLTRAVTVAKIRAAYQRYSAPMCPKEPACVLPAGHAEPCAWRGPDIGEPWEHVRALLDALAARDQALTEARAESERLTVERNGYRADLAECGRLSGADTSGDVDEEESAERAVDRVREMRREHDEARDAEDILRDVDRALDGCPGGDQADAIRRLRAPTPPTDAEERAARDSLAEWEAKVPLIAQIPLVGHLRTALHLLDASRAETVSARTAHIEATVAVKRARDERDAAHDGAIDAVIAVLEDWDGIGFDAALTRIRALRKSTTETTDG